MLLPGVDEACRRLADAGWLLVVVTNQPDIARGTAHAGGGRRDQRGRRPRTADHRDRRVPARRRRRLRVPEAGPGHAARRRAAVGRRPRRAASWSAIGGATSKPDARPVCARSSSTTATTEQRPTRARPRRRRAWPRPPTSCSMTASRAAADRSTTGTSHWVAVRRCRERQPRAGVPARADHPRRVERDGAPARVLDIGSGQGDLLASLRERWPRAELAGLELSAEGIRARGEKVPAPGSSRSTCCGRRGAARARGLGRRRRVQRGARARRRSRVGCCATASRCLAPGGLARRHRPGRSAHRVRPITSVIDGTTARAALQTVLEQADLDVERVSGAGFPFFNLYKLIVLLRGEGARARRSRAAEPPSRLAVAVMRVFGVLLDPRCNSSRFGWQLVATRPARAGLHLDGATAASREHCGDERRSSSACASRSSPTAPNVVADARARRRSAHPGLHDEPDADAPGRRRRLRDLRQGAHRADHRHSRSRSR